MAISNGNAKLGKIPNVSLPPIKSCGNCSGCSTECYALKSYRMYPTAKASWEANYKLARTNRGNYMITISQYLRKHRPSFFRWHVSGDILDQLYLNSMASLARNYPDTQFLAFTKMYHLNYANMPKNLHIVFSAWPGTNMPRKNFPIAYMQDGTENRVPSDARECPGNCESCGMCWSLKKGESVVFHKH